MIKAKVVKEEQTCLFSVFVDELELITFDITPRSPEFIDDFIALEDEWEINHSVYISKLGDYVTITIQGQNGNEPVTIRLPVLAYLAGMYQLKQLLN